MDIFLLYLFTRVDTLSQIAAVVAVLSTIVLLLAQFFVPMIVSVEDNERTREWASGFVFWRRCLLWAITIGTAIFVTTPTQRDLAIIVGGKLAINAAQSETAKKVYAIVQSRLDDEIERLKKK